MFHRKKCKACNKKFYTWSDNDIKFCSRKKCKKARILIENEV